MSLNTDKSTSVTDALNTRITARAFLDKPVPKNVLRQIFETAQRSPSGGNLQPWRVHVITEPKLDKFRKEAVAAAMGGKKEDPTHPAYPAPLWEPHRSWRYKLGEDMYALLGIEKDDKAGRIGQFMKNMEFFGAPVGVIITVDKRMEAPQHMDIGIYLQSLMLLAREAGLHTAPQGWWRNWPETVAEHIDIPEGEEILVGMSLGYGDPDQAINDLYADRADLETRVHFIE